MAQWRYIGNTTFNATIPEWLDAVYTLGTKVTYYDGSTRTPGSGQAGTYSRYQAAGVTEAVYATPATDTLNVRYIWAGRSTAATPTMATPDSYVTNTAYVSINKNSGAFNAWDAASPFTSGQFFGYWNSGWGTGVGAGTLFMWECESAVYYVSAIGTATRHGALGAWLKPGSTEAADAESDGKLYGLMTSGGISAIGSFWGIAKTGINSIWFGNQTSANRHHTGIFNPGAATIKTCYVNSVFAISNSASTFTLPSGKFAVLADSLPIIQVAAPNTLLGVLDSMAPFGIAALGQVLSDSGASKDIGYVVAEQSGINNESALLIRNEP